MVSVSLSLSLKWKAAACTKRNDTLVINFTTQYSSFNAAVIYTDMGIGSN